MSNNLDVEVRAKKYFEPLNVPNDLKEETFELIKAMVSHECFENSDYTWTLNDFELGQRLGRGKFGRVYVAREKKSGYMVALKALSKRELVKGHVESQLLREIEIQSRLKHPNVLQLLTWFHDDFRIYLVLELACRGELYKHLKDSPEGRFPPHISAKYIYQVADAINYCHRNHVIHRDIKPENILLTVTDDIKLADFGWSVHAPSLKRKTMCGTIDYLPPEMVSSESYSYLVDNWCIGILCYEFLVGRPPFESEHSQDTYAKIKNLSIEYPSCIPPGAKDLISKLLVNNRKRLSLTGVMNHFWIQENMSQ